MKKVTKLPKQNLGERIYTYETISRNKLMPKQPVIVRIDCRHFRKLIKQTWLTVEEDNKVDARLINAFIDSTKYICENTDNIEFAFYQRDEVILFLKDYSHQDETQYLGGDIQKLVSLISSKFTYRFNACLQSQFENIAPYNNPVYFYAIAYNVPQFEVVNNFIFKQQESQKYCKEGSISNGISFYKQEMEVDCSAKLDERTKQLSEKIPDLPTTKMRNKWIVDLDPPIFADNKYFIENLVY